MTINGLLVDDDPMFVRAISLGLSSLGYDFKTCSNGLQAQEILKNDPSINLVITDIVMPEVDGLELSQYIRSTFCKESKYIIAVSSGASSIDRRSALACAGLYCDDTMNKPFSKQQLYDILEKAKEKIGITTNMHKSVKM
tara:strand:- start:66 stop:485 length:420 start_codon:yes stop_codon:yes gene_type:complete